jgi:hypothetical protein
MFGIKEGDRAIIMVPELPVLEISSNVISEGGSAQQAAYMDRRKVRAEFEKRFTAARMARAYFAAYRALLAHLPATARLPGGCHAAGRGRARGLATGLGAACEATWRAGLEPGGLRR